MVNPHNTGLEFRKCVGKKGCPSEGFNICSILVDIDQPVLVLVCFRIESNERWRDRTRDLSITHHSYYSLEQISLVHKTSVDGPDLLWIDTPVLIGIKGFEAGRNMVFTF